MENRSVSQSIAESETGAPEALEKRIRHQFMLEYEGEKGEVNTLPSKTVPDQSLTVQELLLNHTRGHESLLKTYPDEYFEDFEIPVIRDLNDLYDARIRLEERFKEVEQLMKEKDENQRHPTSPVNVDPNHNTDSGEKRSTGESKTD